MSPESNSAVRLEPSSKPRRAKRLALAAAAVVLVTFSAYVAGRLQAESKIADAEQQVRAASDQRDRSERSLSATRAQVLELEARRRLHLSSLELEARNFGIAEQHVRHAEKLLARAGPSAAQGELASLRAALSGLRFLATEDVAVQQQKLRDLMRRFDAAVPPRP